MNGFLYPHPYPVICQRRPFGRWTLGVLLALASAFATAGDTGTTLRAQAVSSKVWYFEGLPGMASRENRGFMSNAGFVETSEGVVVFDALATPALAEQMLAEIRRHTRLPIRRVILSHYHADHFYGLQVFKAAGAEIWARHEGQRYLASALASERLAQRRRDLAPWVDEHTHLVPADRWLDFAAGDPIGFELGGVRFELLSGGSSHSPEDLMLSIPGEGVLFAGDLFFSGRLPFVVDGNTREWLRALERMERSGARIAVPGHGPASRSVSTDLQTTRAYLRFLRTRMGQAVEALQSFEEAYAATDWSNFRTLATFDAANRRNAYSVYLEMQAEMLGDVTPDAARPTEPPAH